MSCAQRKQANSKHTNMNAQHQRQQQHTFMFAMCWQHIYGMQFYHAKVVEEVEAIISLWWDACDAL